MASEAMKLEAAAANAATAAPSSELRLEALFWSVAAVVEVPT